MKEKWFGARITGPSLGTFHESTDRSRKNAHEYGRRDADDLVDDVRLRTPDPRVVVVEVLLGARVAVDLRLHLREPFLLVGRAHVRIVRRAAAAGRHARGVRTYSLSAMGTDRPGIIAAVAERLVAHGVNVTDSQMGILRGFFAMTLVVTAPDEVDDDALAADLRAAGNELHLEALTLRPVPDDPGASAPAEPTHVVSVHGADHPGILAAVTRSLAAAGVNVCDLRTRLTPDDVWVMVIHVALPAETRDGAVEAALQAVGELEGVGVALHPSEPDLL